MLLGELSLDGALRHVRGILPISMSVKDAGYEGIVVPAEDADEAVLVENLNVYPVKNLKQAVQFLEDLTGLNVHVYSY